LALWSDAADRDVVLPFWSSASGRPESGGRDHVSQHFALPAQPPAALPATARLNGLTPRETEVLDLVARGRSNAEIAGDLFLAEQTVKTHVSRILDKLAIRDRAQAVVVAYESGLVKPGES
jgi:DNA-binding NarL/FixJ family response regulator